MPRKYIYTKFVPIIPLKFPRVFTDDYNQQGQVASIDEAAVELTSKNELSGSVLKFPPEKCLTWETLVFVGVGASGSTANSCKTNGPEPAHGPFVRSLRPKIGGKAVTFEK
jgi:hypothetical protein